MNMCCGKRAVGAMIALLASLAGMASARAQPPTDPPRLQEISDAELALMRGRYTLGGNTVAWFGVSLISQWHSGDGQQLSAGLQLGLDLRSGTPKFSYQPTVNIARVDGSDASADGLVRQIDSSALANASGFVQAVQLAGDRNRVSNQALLVVRDGPVPAGADGTAAGNAGSQAGAATAQAYVQGQRAGVILQLAGQGQVQQWLGNGQVGQSVALASDGSWVSNQLRLEVVRGPALTGSPLALNVAQALGSSRGLGSIGGP